MIFYVRKLSYLYKEKIFKFDIENIDDIYFGDFPLDFCITPEEIVSF